MKSGSNLKVDLEFIPFEILKNMDLSQQVKFIIKKTKEGKILIFDSQLNPKEEAKLISETMKHIDKKFSGIEICSLHSEKTGTLIEKAKSFIFKGLTGKMRGTSIVGPAKIIKQIKRDPESISISMK
ncbi:MAG: DUF2073 domain-containing protein [Candidatus Nanoarchaeia archaeon]|nr:DUF2073 domain-containing protein [Candidatus Nanoarchaeia archaeon]MDD5054228.1 DUF2073 domain-containing protein [Candidatus Nanoarchaeia archaeon]MDD5499275.1 DUF2073 domain-containing protein [Candidatus Nanoarchaeia archaeon]